jgi:hypothetical protein
MASKIVKAPRDTADAYVQAEEADRAYVEMLDLLDRIKSLPASS